VSKVIHGMLFEERKKCDSVVGRRGVGIERKWKEKR
jgi:hypothetical protein